VGYQLVTIETFPGVSLDFDQERICTIDLPITKGNFGEVIFAGDQHYGSESYAESHHHKYLSLMNSIKHLKIVTMGDTFEFGELSSFLTEEESPARKQIEMFVEDYKPLAKKIVACVWGNHDQRFARLINRTIDLYDYLKLQLGNPEMVTLPPNRGVIIVFRAGEQSYPTFVMHSTTRAAVNMEVQLKRSSQIWMVPLICHGHTHKMGWFPRTFFSVSRINGQYYRSIFRQYLLSTGCFLRYPAYAEEGSYPVSDVGAPIVRFYANKPELEYIDPRVTYSGFFERANPWEHAKVNVPEIYDLRKCIFCGSTNTIVWSQKSTSENARRKCTRCGRTYTVKGDYNTTK